MKPEKTDKKKPIEFSGPTFEAIVFAFDMAEPKANPPPPSTTTPAATAAKNKSKHRGGDSKQEELMEPLLSSSGNAVYDYAANDDTC